MAKQVPFANTKVSARSKVLKILNSIPNDGCLLVFNAYPIDFRKVATESFKGLLRIHHTEQIPYGEARNAPLLRDLYITWRE
jgi:hypothetical protein